MTIVWMTKKYKWGLMSIFGGWWLVLGLFEVIASRGVPLRHNTMWDDAMPNDYGVIEGIHRNIDKLSISEYLAPFINNLTEF